MRREHVEIGRLTQDLVPLRSRLDLAAPGDVHAKALRRVLYGLYAVLRLHLAKEEEIYLQLDDRLTREEALQLFEVMEETTLVFQENARKVACLVPVLRLGRKATSPA